MTSDAGESKPYGSRNTNSGIERVPPHNFDAERAIIGAMLIDENAAAGVRQYLKVDDFYSGRHKEIFKALSNLFNNGTRPDLLTLSGELEKQGTLKEAGGYDYIAGLTHNVYSSVNSDFYAGIVLECSLRRGLIKISGQAATNAYDETVDPKVLLEHTQHELFKISDPTRIFRYKKTEHVVTNTVDYLEYAIKYKPEYTGIPSGFYDLDYWTSGFQNGELIIIGARPGMGKTAIGLNMAANIAIRQRKSAAFFSLEMTDVSLMIRLLSSEANIDSYKLKKGMITGNEREKMMNAAEEIHEAPLFIVDMPHMTIGDIRTMARMLKIQENIEILFIDYIGLISEDKRDQKRYEFVSQVSRALKGLARELNIPVVALSQLRREAEKEKPGLADIRESGSIEQDADMVMFINRDRNLDKTNEEQEKEPTQKVQLILAKNRNGPVGTIGLLFFRQFTKFVPMVKELTK
ncbi:MAG: replicative DNA helicase [Treponema sp.]|nr:replicative DNA helicase [Treponema sp.]